MSSAALTPPPTATDALARQYRRAEALVARKKGRFTAIRRTVYLRLLESDVPLGAYDILDRLGGVGSQKPPTVYRALDWLIAHGLVAKLATNSRYVVVGTDRETAEAFLICRDCGETHTLRAEALTQSLTRTAQQRGFSDIQPVLELVGSCCNPQS